MTSVRYHDKDCQAYNMSQLFRAQDSEGILTSRPSEATRKNAGHPTKAWQPTKMTVTKLIGGFSFYSFVYNCIICPSTGMIQTLTTTVFSCGNLQTTRGKTKNILILPWPNLLPPGYDNLEDLFKDQIEDGQVLERRPVNVECPSEPGLSLKTVWNYISCKNLVLLLWFIVTSHSFCNDPFCVMLLFCTLQGMVSPKMLIW